MKLFFMVSQSSSCTLEFSENPSASDLDNLVQLLKVQKSILVEKPEPVGRTAGGSKTGRPPTFPPEEKLEIAKDLSEGTPVKDIQEAHGISRASVYRAASEIKSVRDLAKGVCADLYKGNPALMALDFGVSAKAVASWMEGREVPAKEFIDRLKKASHKKGRN